MKHDYTITRAGYLRDHGCRVSDLRVNDLNKGDLIRCNPDAVGLITEYCRKHYHMA